MTDPGRLFMFGLYGTRPTRRAVSLFKSTGASGVLLLARNIESPARTRALIDELQQRLGRRLLTAVDHEGGWVLRFASGVTAFPGNAALGRARDPRLAYAVGRQMALELAPLEIRMNLAPVLDVATRDYNPGVGIRSFGADPRLASRLGAAFARGLQDHGVSACAKHFPGKGAATVDAHVDLPTIRLSRASYERTHLLPFRAAVAAGVDAVMTSHALIPAFERVPATFSTKLVKGLLRERMGYDGLIVTDDLCMGAITRRWPVAEACLRALEAGHDQLMIAHDEQGMADAVELLREAAGAGAVAEADLARSAARIDRLLVARRRGPRPSAERGESLARTVAKKAVRVLRRGKTPLPVPRGRGTLVLVPDFAEVRERFTFEGGPRGPEALVRRLAAGCRVERTPVEAARPGAWEAAAAAAERVVFLCFEARRFRGQAAALARLAKTAPDKTVAVLIRSSWDLGLSPAATTVVDSAGYRAVSLAAALRTVLSEER